MTIWYLQHSGFAVDTGNHLLVFDYYIDLPRGGTLEQGAVTPALLRDKPMAVFASHNHHDHFNPIILDWKRQYPDISLYLGDDIPPREEAKTVPPGLTVEENGLTITALRSTDQGVAFVVECDDNTIYHAGDLNWWHWDGEPEEWNEEMGRSYRRQIDLLAGRKIDLAFLPVDPRLGRTQLWGAEYFLEKVSPSAWVPMHFWEKYGIFAAMEQSPQWPLLSRGLVRLEHRGQKIVLEGG